MASNDMTALETQLRTLDQDTAQRVTRLVFECSVSLDLALLAVQEANREDNQGGEAVNNLPPVENKPIVLTLTPSM